MKKKIIVLPAEYPTKDNPLAGIFTKDQVTMFAKNGYNVTVLYNYFISLKKVSFKNIRNIILNSKTSNNKNLTTTVNTLFSTYFSFLKLKLDYYLTKKYLTQYIEKKGKPDLIICHFAFPTGNTAMKIYKEFDIPYIIVEHSTGYFTGLYSDYKLKIIKKALDNSILIIAVSNFLRKKLIKLTNSKIVTLGNIVDNRFFKIENKITNKKKVNFIIISELVKKKQVMKLVKIFNDIKNDNIKFHLNIVGDGPEYKKITKFVTSNKMEKDISILGIKNKKEISDLLNKSDYLVSCSKVETFGITIAEAIAKGVPSIVLNSGGHSDFINTSNSYLVNNFEELKNKLIEVIKKPKKFDTLKMKNFIYDRFSEKILIKKYDNLIKKIL